MRETRLADIPQISDEAAAAFGSGEKLTRSQARKAVIAIRKATQALHALRAAEREAFDNHHQHQRSKIGGIREYSSSDLGVR